MVIVRASISNVVQVVGLKNVDVVENLIKGNLLDPNIGLDTGFINPHELIPLDSFAEKIKESIIFSSIPIQSYNIIHEPTRPIRDIKPAPTLCSHYHRKKLIQVNVFNVWKKGL